MLDFPETPNKCGIPAGNTVAVVGDPGTGKTTFLLEFLDKGSQKQVSDRASNTGYAYVELEPKSNDEEGREQRARAYDSFNKLFICNRGNIYDPRRANEAKRGTLRCFVSLESSLHRMLASHTALLQRWCNKAPASDGDAYIFIDATSFLSGRLEDRLRYGMCRSERDAKAGDQLVLTLGGHGLQDDEHFGLYHERESTGGKPERIEHLEDSFLSELHGASGIAILTRALHEPEERIRLLKDLLAEIFRRTWEKYENRLVAIDSLSALLTPFGPRAGKGHGTARRLHMLNMVRWLEASNATTLLACEATSDQSLSVRLQPLLLGAEERYLASGIIQLYYHAYRSGDMVRYLRVLKMRGAKHDMRPYAYDLDDKGIASIELLFGEAAEENST